MIDYVTRESAAWQKISRIAAQMESALILAPFGYGIDDLCNSVQEEVRRQSNSKFIFVDLSTIASKPKTRRLTELWNIIAPVIGAADRDLPLSEPEFQDLFTAEIGRSESSYYLCLKCPADDADFGLEILRMFDSELLVSATGRLAVIAIDDYSTMRQLLLNNTRSFFEMLRIVHFGPLTISEVSRCVDLSVREKLSKKVGDDFYQQVFDITGGHPGLIRNVLQLIRRSEKPPSRKNMLSSVARDPLIANVCRKIPLKADEVAAALDRCSVPNGSTERARDETSQLLKQLGLLFRIRPGVLGTLGGALTSAVRARLRATRAFPRRSVTAISTSKLGPESTGSKRMGLKIGVNDIVVIQLSDLHFGAKHAFRMEQNGRKWNEEKPLLLDMILRDLQLLGIRNRIDGLMLTGDFVETGLPSEFEIASKFTTDLLSALKLSAQQSLLIPGNHDVLWNPTEFEKDFDSQVASKKNYTQFATHIKAHAANGVDLIDLRSSTNRLIVIGFDSNHIEGPDAPGVGWIATKAFELAHSLLQARLEADRTSASIFVAVHHHVFPVVGTSVSDAKKRQISLLANAADLLSFVRAVGARCVIHGHQHQPCITSIVRWPSDSLNMNGGTLAVAAGSAGVKLEELGPIAHNHYYIYVVGESGLSIVSRRTSDSEIAFSPHGLFRKT